MFKSKTVFIIGAGASEEAGLPIGSELTDVIADLLRLHIDYGQSYPNKGDVQIYTVLKSLVQNDDSWRGNAFIATAHSTADAMDIAPSIDTFLETHASNREIVLLGKLGIARAIILAEQNSKLAPRQQGKPFEMKQLGPTWYVSLARQLFTGIPVESPEKAFENVSFIVFNYDRCLQTFLAHALSRNFLISMDKAVEILSGVTIVHPYGSLGSYFPRQPDHLPFASEAADLLQIAERIKTYSESVEDPAIIDAMRKALDEADTAVFLGFAFHEQNMNLLNAGSYVLKDRRTYATAYKVSPPDCEVIKSQISILFGEAPNNRTELCSGKCRDLFSMYWRSLTA
ncbi:hypothetical protein OKA06_13435 [Novosphingobium sp. MW5]|nr:hypothetical protein [Novosphingobium sp. MW5]